jgi:SAM-dependent methyltransferase
MELKRKPFQGVFNIVRFNWHFYLLAALLLVSLILFRQYLPEAFQFLAFWFALPAILAIGVSLIASCYIYDLSDLYHFKWLSNLDNKKVLNIHAGFDETSDSIKRKYPSAALTVCDFYDPAKHSEISIRRARKAYPPSESAIPVASGKLPFSDGAFDFSLAILSAHEIRDERERIEFFRELARVTKASGQIFVTEHLRDLNNFLAYTVGFFHFYSRSTWLQTFAQAGLGVRREIKITPFIITFILEKNGDTF